MRNCPVCQCDQRALLWGMDYRVPDGWPIMDHIDWYTCDYCGLIYGDGDFDQAMLDRYYRIYYGYGVDGPENTARLRDNARMIGEMVGWNPNAVIVDFGGGKSILKDWLDDAGFTCVSCVEPGVSIQEHCDVIFCSHVLEHIYDLPETMARLVSALKPDGTLIIDGPDATGLLLRWQMPMLDFNTKHIQHFRLVDYLALGRRWGLEAVGCRPYDDVRPGWKAPAYQLTFIKGFDVAAFSRAHVLTNISTIVKQLRAIDYPVNVWGLGDIAWHALAWVDLPVLDYIDNDPAYRGSTYNGKPVQERPTNTGPIVVIAQGQRQRVIDRIRALGIENEIIVIKADE